VTNTSFPALAVGSISIGLLSTCPHRFKRHLPEANRVQHDVIRRRMVGRTYCINAQVWNTHTLGTRSTHLSSTSDICTLRQVFITVCRPLPGKTFLPMRLQLVSRRVWPKLTDSIISQSNAFSFVRHDPFVDEDVLSQVPASYLSYNRPKSTYSTNACWSTSFLKSAYLILVVFLYSCFWSDANIQLFHSVYFSNIGRTRGVDLSSS
jgi:hypothetical protein